MAYLDLMNHLRDPKRLDFVMTTDGSVLMISFFGDLTAATLQDAERHALPLVGTAKIKFVVLSFLGVQSMDRQSVSLLARFKVVLRDLGKTIRLCELKLDLKLILENHGVFADGETMDTLLDAMRDFELLRLKS